MLLSMCSTVFFIINQFSCYLSIHHPSILPFIQKPIIHSSIHVSYPLFWVEILFFYSKTVFLSSLSSLRAAAPQTSVQKNQIRQNRKPVNRHFIKDNGDDHVVSRDNLIVALYCTSNNQSCNLRRQIINMCKGHTLLPADNIIFTEEMFRYPAFLVIRGQSESSKLTA